MAQPVDPRWHKLTNTDWRCTCCGQPLGGLPDVHFVTPQPWLHEQEVEENGAVMENRDVLTEDFCKLEEHRFIRCVLPFRIIDAPEGNDFAFGVWGSLKTEHFDQMVANFDTDQGDLGPYFSWLCNLLPDAPDGAVRCQMQPRGGRQRPVLAIRDDDCPYYPLQQEGVTLDQVLGFVTAAGSDIARHLDGTASADNGSERM